MTKHIILITGASDAPPPEIVGCLQTANIAFALRSLNDLSGFCEERCLAVLYPLQPEDDLPKLRKIASRLHQFFPGIPLVACEDRRLESAADKPLRFANDELKSVGFRAVLESAAQLPALLRLIEDSPATGELKLTPEFDSRPTSAALSLPRAADDEQARAAFVLTASLHLAKNQTEAAQIALDGLAQLVESECWSIFLVARGALPNDVVLQYFVSRTGLRGNSRSVAGGESAPVASHAAQRAATGLETIAHNEAGRFVLALPLVSEDVLIGVLELLRGGAAFSDAEIALLERLTIPIAAALQNSVRISEAERLSHTDDLTQLHNARYLRQFLVNETKRARRYSSNLGAVFLDLDDFKQINDAHGHLVGSHVLMEVASLILPSVRDTDCVVRYGGDEFVIILPEASLDEAIHVAQRIRSKLAEHRFSGGRRLKLQLTASFGIAVFPQHASSPQQLISAADSAMYEAKAAGKNCVRTSIGTRMQIEKSETGYAPTSFTKIPDEKLIS